MTDAWALTVWGAPRTKKTSNVAFTVPVKKAGVATGARRPVIAPSKVWTAWVKTARIDAPEAWGVLGVPAISCEVNCRALFYREKNIGDAVGFYQGLADLLQKRGVVWNDRLIVSWDGSRLLKDAEHPRVEVLLEPVFSLQ